ncbi:MAG: hypothetical protein NC434_05650 [Ruminococcus sp.]|nr:hypothetical protein [Ruminococcus sp.]
MRYEVPYETGETRQTKDMVFAILKKAEIRADAISHRKMGMTPMDCRNRQP